MPCSESPAKDMGEGWRRGEDEARPGSGYRPFVEFFLSRLCSGPFVWWEIEVGAHPKRRL